MASTLNSYGQLTLMLCAGAGNTSGNDLSSLRENFAAIFANGFIIDVFDSFYAESANFSAGFTITVSIHDSSPFDMLKRQIAVVGIDLFKTSKIADR